MKKFILGILIISVAFVLWFTLPKGKSEREKIVFYNDYNSVQDSIILLGKLFDPKGEKLYLNSYVISLDSILIMSGMKFGKIDSVTTNNRCFTGIESRKAMRVISLIKYSLKNYISGMYPGGGTGEWTYVYRSDVNFSDFEGLRSLFIVNNPYDTLKPTFNYYYNILDRKGKIILISRNRVP